MGARQAELPSNPCRQVTVELTLYPAGHPEVCVVGDLAYVESGSGPLPMAALVVSRQEASLEPDETHDLDHAGWPIHRNDRTTHGWAG